MKADEILKKHEDANEMHFHEVDRKWIIEAMEEYAALRQPLVSGQLPTNEEIDLILEQDVPLSEEYQKYTEIEKILMMAATKAGAKWFRSSLIEGNFR